MPVFILILGPPGAGKGTQADIVSSILHLPHISSGEIFRENFKNKTQLGKLANRYISRGELVPDEITIEMIRTRLSNEDCEKGAILDGFPRTPHQAAALDEMLLEFGGRVDVVPYIKVPVPILVERLSGRLTCRAENHIFHENYNPPKKKGVCDYDNSELYQREDDRPDTVKHRIEVYLENTKPLIEYYRKKGILIEFDGTLDIQTLNQKLLLMLPKVK